MKRVIIIQRRLPEYRLSFFDALRECLAGLGVELHLWHGAPAAREVSQGNEGALPWAQQAACRYIGGAGGDGGQFVWLSVPGAEVSRAELVVLPHESKMLSNYLVLIGSGRSNRPRVAFWGHGGNFQSHAVGGLPERFKAWSARRALWYFAYTALSVDRVVAAGFPRERTTCLNNAIDTRELVRWRESVTAGELEELRRALNVKGEGVAVALGSLSRERRLEFLFDAADRLRGEMEGFELVVVGDGAMRGQVVEFARERPWIHWVGAKHGREKVLHAMLGKVMLNPGMVGLNILDSFATAVPMVTTDCGIHSPEIAYLRNGENGLMTENTVEAYVSASAELLAEAKSLQCKVKSEKLEIERVSLGHIPVPVPARGPEWGIYCQFTDDQDKTKRKAGSLVEPAEKAGRGEGQDSAENRERFCDSRQVAPPAGQADPQPITNGLYARLVEGCKRDAEVYTLEAMVENFAQGILKAVWV